MKRLAIVRTAGSVINPQKYNCQEIGLAKALVKRGWDVSVIMAGKETSHHRIKIDDTKFVDFYTVRFRAINQILAWFSDIKDVLNNISPDIIQIHEFGMLMSWRLVKIAKQMNIPVVLVQGTYQPSAKPIHRVLEQLLNNTIGRSTLKSVDNIGYKTLAAKRWIEKFCSRDAIMTPVGIDVTPFKSIENQSGERIPKSLLYVGEIHQRRNPLLLLEILKNLPEEYTLTIVGSGDMSDHVTQNIKKWGLENRVRMMGKIPQQELVKLYKSHELFILVSDYEIFGMVILEAMYFGLPVISTATAGSREIMKGDFKSFVLDKKDAALWADAIMKYCELSDQKKTAISNSCEQLIRDKYVWDNAAVNFENLYLKVLKSAQGDAMMKSGGWLRR